MSAPAKKGLAVLIGMGGPKGSPDSEPDVSQDDGVDEGAEATGEALVAALKAGDGAAAYRAVCDIVDTYKGGK